MKTSGYESLLNGKWYEGDPCRWLSVENESVSFDFEGQDGGGFDHLTYIQSLRDYLTYALKNNTYKEGQKDYILKSIKVYNLWIIDFLSNVKLENERFIVKDFIGNEEVYLEFEFSDVLEQEKSILKGKDFFIYLLKKEHMFKNLKGYKYMYFDKEVGSVFINFYDYVIEVVPYISNKYEEYEYYTYFRKKPNMFVDKYFKTSELEDCMEVLKEINNNCNKVKNIVESTSYKQYLKKLKK